MKPIALAVVAHPDDIEFRMAGTLLLLRQAGWELHYLTLASGSCGSAHSTAAQTRRIRRREAQAAARLLGAHWHPSLVDDLEILYELKSLRRLAAIVREVRPTVLLTHPPLDYMEDHTNTCRLAVTAAFARGMPNFRTVPARPPCEGEVTVYHCLPHGRCDPLGRLAVPQFFVNIRSVLEQKRAALNAHRSQAGWLERSQGLSALAHHMEADARAVGRQSRKFQFAEGWWRHLHLGFCRPEADPLRDALGSAYLSNPAWKAPARLGASLGQVPALQQGQW